MTKNNNNLPIFLWDNNTERIFKEIIFSIPKNTKIFLVGGAVRNALFYKISGKILPQRDYDLLLIGNRDKFVNNLKKKKFVYGKIRRKLEIVLKKKKISKPKNFSDYVILDISTSKEKSIIKNIKENANFTINAFALPLKEVFSKNWNKKIISPPNALPDLKNKIIRINKISHPANLYACIRFMSQGFKKPTKKEINYLLISLSKLEKYRFKKNVNKVFNYVGGGRKARRFAKRLGLKEDIFNFEVIKKLQGNN